VHSRPPTPFQPWGLTPPGTATAALACCCPTSPVALPAQSGVHAAAYIMYDTCPNAAPCPSPVPVGGCATEHPGLGCWRRGAGLEGGLPAARPADGQCMPLELWHHVHRGRAARAPPGRGRRGRLQVGAQVAESLIWHVAWVLGLEEQRGMCRCVAVCKSARAASRSAGVKPAVRTKRKHSKKLIEHGCLAFE